ncbi:unnamed protein product [Chrysodeixis includens]|uniref:Uncharacterized protein n=1 Tax=Chrysodeixis includens TaxID=689277 RepID=A0A9P0BSF4_CHRIL|nr:unnamed protein product [Chrysodeixis includens]
MNDNYTHVDTEVFYITENIMGPFEDSSEYEQLLNNFNSLLSGSCSCSGNCTQLCRCVQASGGDNYLAYLADGQKKFTLIPKSNSCPIIECNDICSCSVVCGNRVVQTGPAEGLEIRSCDKGYGLFTATFIHSGTFICEYAGELITANQATKRHENNETLGKSNYIFCLREMSNDRQPILTIVDPAVFGNIGRYINHSCEPNCIVTPVRCGSPVPKFAIFASTDIEENEELTFNYGLNDDVKQNTTDRTKCLCKSKNCSGFMPFQSY